jgi:hypothetical protein
MALGQARIPADEARRAIATLITEELMLPPIALILRRCREMRCSAEFFNWRCPECGSRRVVGTLGEAAVCFDCDWRGTLSEGGRRLMETSAPSPIAALTTALRVAEARSGQAPDGPSARELAVELLTDRARETLTR